MIPPEVARIAESPAAADPPPSAASDYRRVLNERYCLLLGQTFTSVSRLRLAPDEVEATVEEIRALTAGQAWKTAWWVGGSATPGDLAERLLALGLRRATDPSWEPYGTAMATVTPPPAAPPGVEASRVTTYEDFATATEIALEAFEEPDEDRERVRAALPAEWRAANEADGAVAYLARVDGRPVASARARFLDGAVLLVGGATLPDARGRGAYRALVRARWDDAAAHGTSALVVLAGERSRPILERLGFEAVTRIEILLDDPR